MGFEIIDGTGKGYSAKVDSDHRVASSARIQSDAQINAMNGQYYNLDSGKHTLTSNGGKILWFKFTETAKIMLSSYIAINWNGGSTNYNRSLYWQIWANDPVPTANHTASQVYNSNNLSSNDVNSSVYVWDGVGDGMTIAAGGYPASNYFAAPGYTVLELDHKWVFGPNTSMSIYCKGAEIGDVAIQMGFSVISNDEYRNLTE